MGYIYLLMTFDEDGEEVFKIGISKNHPNFRIKQLQTGNHKKIELLKYYESVNYKKIERFMHVVFASKRGIGEWFKLSDSDVLGFIDKIKAADETINYLIENNEFYK